MEGLSLDPRMLYKEIRLKSNPVKNTNQKFKVLLKSSLSKTDKKESLKKVCTSMESIFINQMLKSMRKNVQRSDLIKKSTGEDIFKDMLYNEYSQKMAESGDFGIGKLLYKSLDSYI